MRFYSGKVLEERKRSVGDVLMLQTMGNALLGLGEPGAGKTTLLLELAEALAEEARQHEHLPVPIVLTLDTWAQHKGKLEDWFAREASRVYGIGIDLFWRLHLRDFLAGLSEEEVKKVCNE